MGEAHKRALSVVAAAAVGYYAVDRLYRYVRSHADPEARKNAWVCPGVGVAGALVTAGVAGMVLCRSEPCCPRQQCPVMSSVMGEPKIGDGVKLSLPSFSMGS
jgi:hypothetical protein